MVQKRCLRIFYSLSHNERPRWHSISSVTIGGWAGHKHSLHLSIPCIAYIFLATVPGAGRSEWQHWHMVLKQQQEGLLFQGELHCGEMSPPFTDINNWCFCGHSTLIGDKKGGEISPQLSQQQCAFGCCHCLGCRIALCIQWSWKMANSNSYWFFPPQHRISLQR